MIIVKYDVIFQLLGFLFCFLLRDDIIIKIDQSNHTVASVGNTSTTSRAIQTPYSTLLRPQYWTFEGQYGLKVEILTSEMKSVPPKMVYIMCHTMVLLEKCLMLNFAI